MLVLEPEPERRRMLACYVRGAGVDVFELGEVAALCWYLERSSRRPELLVVGLAIANEAVTRRMMAANAGLPILLVARSTDRRAPEETTAHPVLVVDEASQGEALARRVLGVVREAAASRRAHKSA